MVPFTAVIVLLVASTVDASCTASDGPCHVGSGHCTTAVRLALTGDLAAAADAAFYGKYCGNLNKCQVVDSISRSDEDYANVCEVDDDYRRLGKSGKSRGKKGKKHGKSRSKIDEPCPAVPCDAIDHSCSVHDACLDNEILINPPPEGERIPVPQRCMCDVNLVYDMAIQAGSTEPTGLCDAAFYNDPIADELPVTPIGLLQHEAVFVAGPFCCDILADLNDNGVPDCGEDNNTDQTKFAVALQFCQQFIGGLGGFGIEIC